MKVITINEECHGFIGIADTKEHAIDFLIDENWLSGDTELPSFDEKDKTWKDRSVKEKLGENWENVLKDSDIRQINDLLGNAFLLYEWCVYTGGGVIPPPFFFFWPGRIFVHFDY